MSETRRLPHSLLFDSRPKPLHVFRGSIEEYLRKVKYLSGIVAVQVTGAEVSEGVYDASIVPDPERFSEFLQVINKEKVKKLDLTGCTLNESLGCIIGEALKDNTSLEMLGVTTSQLGAAGIVSILNGLKENKHLLFLYMRSYNMHHYLWDAEELKPLIELISTNDIIKRIELPENSIEKEGLDLLSKAFIALDKQIDIVGFRYRSCPLPAFNHENALNGELDKWSSKKFI